MLDIFQTLFAPPRHLIFPLVASWIGMYLSERRARQRGGNAEALGNLIFYGLLGWVLGGRLLYAAAHLPVFLQAPASLVSPNAGLFDPLGAAATGILSALIYGRRHKMAFWQTMDSLTPFFAVLAVGVGLSHLAAGTAFGKPADLPWAVDEWGARRHPTQIYETLAALIIVTIVLLQRSTRPGLQFLNFAALSAAARIFLEAFRGDSQLLGWGIRLPQLVAWLVLLASFVLLERRLDRHSPPSSPPRPSVLGGKPIIDDLDSRV